MQREHTICRSALAILLLSLVALARLAAAQGQGTGLILPTEDELRSVPLASTPFSGTELPRRVDLSADLPPPGHQGAQNSCVGWTLAYAMKTYQERREEGHELVDQSGRPRADRIFSPAFIYNQVNHGRDGGSHIHDALNLLQQRGVSTWADMPYSDSDHLSQPASQALRNATRYRINTWRQVNVQSTREVKTQLQAGYPVIIGAMVDEGFERYDQPPGWIWRQAVGATKGAHAMLVVGYDDERSAFKLINSWGTEWGDGGYGWVDYEHFRRVVRIGYVAMDARNGPPPTVDPEPVAPEPNEIVATPFDAGVRFSVTSVQHNSSYPNRPDLGHFMRFDGRIRIPGTAGRANQIVIHFNWRMLDGSIGPAVPSAQVEYRDAHGNAACGTAVYPIPTQGLDAGFTAWIAYSALNLPSGGWVSTATGPQYQPARSTLYALPTLFVDNFGIARGDPIPFDFDR